MTDRNGWAVLDDQGRVRVNRHGKPALILLPTEAEWLARELRTAARRSGRAISTRLRPVVVDDDGRGVITLRHGGAFLPLSPIEADELARELARVAESYLNLPPEEARA